MAFLLICSLSASQTQREQRVSLLVMIWYDPYSLVSLHFLLSLSLELYIFCCCSANCFFLPPFLLQVKVPPPATSGVLVKEVVATQSPTALDVEKEPLSGGVAGEARQAVKDAKPISSSASLAIQDLEASQPLVPEDPKPTQTPSPTKTVTIEPTTEFVLGKESLGHASSSTRVGKPYPILY